MNSNLIRKITGSMNLGMINPVDEGILLYGATLIYTGIVGT